MPTETTHLPDLGEPVTIHPDDFDAIIDGTFSDGAPTPTAARAHEMWRQLLADGDDPEEGTQCARISV